LSRPRGRGTVVGEMETTRPAGAAANPYSPPHAAIDAEPPSPAVTGFKSATGLANAIAIDMAMIAVLELAAMVHAFVTIGVMRRLEAGEDVAKDVLAAIDVRTRAIGVLSTILILAAVVLFCLFMPRANRNARSFGSPMSNSPGWAAGWFFVPVAFWWKPYYAMKEIWQGSDPDPTVHAALAPVPALLPLWWWMDLLRSVGGAMSNRITGSWTEIVCRIPSLAAAILAAAVVRAVARRQDERQRRQNAASTPPPATIKADAAL
jgi:hypothetical protein